MCSHRAEPLVWLFWWLVALPPKPEALGLGTAWCLKTRETKGEAAEHSVRKQE